MALKTLRSRDIDVKYNERLDGDGNQTVTMQLKHRPTRLTGDGKGKTFAEAREAAENELELKAEIERDRLRRARGAE